MFLSELKRRKVLREVGAYAVVAWVLLQVADVMLEPLELPLWVMSALTYTALFGVLVVFVFSWRYDITAHGIVRTAPRSSSAGDLPVSGADYAVMGVLATIVVVAAYGMTLALRQPVAIQEGDLDANGVAVLPFLNLNRDPDYDYFSDGIADTVLHMLAQVPKLKVIARTSSFSYKNTNMDMRVIGRQLGVRNILEGSVQFVGDRIRVIAQLIDARDGSHLWSRTFDSETDDIFLIQDQIAGEVALAMKSTVEQAANPRPLHSTSNLAAYREYLLGVQARNLDTKASKEKAVTHFEKATELDPNYVMAYVALADTLLEPSFHRGSKKEIFDRIDAAVETALAIDPDSPDAMASKGIRLQWSGRTEDAEHYINLALENNANLLKVYTGWGWLLRHHLGRLEEALAMAKKAVELDPVSRTTMRQLAEAYAYLGDSVNAAKHYLELVGLHPDYSRAYEGLANIASMEDRLAASVRFMKKASELEPDNARFHEVTAMKLLDIGDAEGCLAELDSAKEVSNEESWYLGLFRMFYHMEVGELSEAEAIVSGWFAENPWWLARVTGAQLLAELGRYEEALEHMEVAMTYRMGPNRDRVDRKNYQLAIQYADLLSKTGGPQEQIDQILSEALKVSQSFPATATDNTTVLIYLVWGRHEEALAEFERQVSAGWRGPGSSFLIPKWNHDVYAPLRGNPEFEELARLVLDDVAAMRASLAQRPELDESDFAFRVE